MQCYRGDLMANIKRRTKTRKKALNLLEELAEDASNLLIIHYSCESFYDWDDGRSPRITSISVKLYKTGQTVSFSIHKTAEVERKLTSIEEHYDALEKVMLDGFMEFVRSHSDCKWLHWNMREANYGFQAINHRHSVVGGEPIEIPHENKIDLADKLKDIYGTDYMDHPRFAKLAQKNNITKKDFLDGKSESEAFQEKKYVQLHHSSLRKVNIIESIFKKVLDNNLKTNAKWYQVYGLSPQGVFEAGRENWIFNLIIFILGVVLTLFLGWILPKVF